MFDYREEAIQSHKGPLSKSIPRETENRGGDVPILEDGQLLDRGQGTGLGGC